MPCWCPAAAALRLFSCFSAALLLLSSFPRPCCTAAALLLHPRLRAANVAFQMVYKQAAVGIVQQYVTPAVGERLKEMYGVEKMAAKRKADTDAKVAEIERNVAPAKAEPVAPKPRLGFGGAAPNKVRPQGKAGFLVCSSAFLKQRLFRCGLSRTCSTRRSSRRRRRRSSCL